MPVDAGKAVEKFPQSCAWRDDFCSNVLQRLGHAFKKSVALMG